MINADCKPHAPLVTARPPPPSEGLRLFLAVPIGDMPYGSSTVSALLFLFREVTRPLLLLGRLLSREPDLRCYCAFPGKQGYVQGQGEGPPPTPSSEPQSSSASTRSHECPQKRPSTWGFHTPNPGAEPSRPPSLSCSSSRPFPHQIPSPVHHCKGLLLRHIERSRYPGVLGELKILYNLVSPIDEGPARHAPLLTFLPWLLQAALNTLGQY